MVCKEKVYTANINAGSKKEMDMRIDELVKRGYEVVYVGLGKPVCGKTTEYFADGTKYNIEPDIRQNHVAKMRKIIQIEDENNGTFR